MGWWRICSKPFLSLRVNFNGCQNMSSFEQVLSGRKSIRGFLPEPVPEKTLSAIFELAQAAPSNCNTQPWKAFCVSGTTLEKLRAELRRVAANDQPPDPDFPLLPGFEGIYRDRQVECAAALYEKIGVERTDKQARKEAALRNFSFFGAPHAVFITMPRTFGIFNALDLGIYLQTLMLSMTHHGVGSCAQGALAIYPSVVRDILDIEDEQAVLVGVSFGFEDFSHPANKTNTDRARIEETISFYR